MERPSRTLRGEESLDAFVERAAACFQRDGYLWLPRLLSPEQVRPLLAAADFEDLEARGGLHGRTLHSQLHLASPAMRGLLDPSPVIELVDRLLALERLGHVDPCHLLNMAAMTVAPGRPAQEWHVDGSLFVPLPEHAPWPDHVSFPTYVVTVMYYLTENGMDECPTECVPGSHRSGRMPEAQAVDPNFRGRGVVRIRPSPGDALLFHSQLWHRAASHQGVRPRHLIQVHYGSAFVGRCLFPYPNHHTPLAFLRSLTPRQQRLLGVKPVWTPFS